MSLKRILGTMLATRLAGRGRRRGFSPTDAVLGGLGYRRRPRLGGKMQLAALGYMAYRAYRDHQARQPSGATSASAGGSGGLGGLVSGVVDSLTGQGAAQGSAGTTARDARQGVADADLARDAEAAEGMSEGQALFLIRAMIAAAYADGAMSEDERQRIMGAIDAAGGSDDDRRTLEREIANPHSTDSLLAEVDDPETAEAFYLASAAAIDGGTEANRRYLDALRQRLSIPDDEAAEVEDLAQ